METPTPFVLIDDAKMQTNSRLYSDPVRVLSCVAPDQVAETLAQIDQALKDGFHVAGYLAYELGYLLEPKLAPLLDKGTDQPLIWMGIFNGPQRQSRDQIEALMRDWAKTPHTITKPTTTQSRETYLSTIHTIQEHIRAGDVYQINYTFKQNFEFSGSAKSLYAHLRQRQRASYGAFLATEDQHIVSLSPELFFESVGDVLRTRPMKGTAPRAARPSADTQLREWLNKDEKSRAENLMIVDLLRNDMARISEVGSVKVSDLFTVETYPTLHQMTSGIEAKLCPDTSFGTVIRALFPCGSVTGAPKVKAMEIIHALEDGARGVYTGAIGYASATDGVRFNVAIRTLTLDNQGHGEMGIGSGIVFDSKPMDEWAECHLKANFVTDAEQPPFELLETLKWSPAAGFELLQLHLDRLQSACDYFCYPYDAAALKSALENAILDQTDAQRIRLTVDGQGTVLAQNYPLPDLSTMTYTIASQVVDTSSPFTYFKTTNRAFYDDARVSQEADEVLFLNAQGQLCEGSISNVFVEKNGSLLTPPISCGLLNGTLRQDLLDSGKACESILTAADLAAPNRVFFGNSVRGLVKARPL